MGFFKKTKEFIDRHYETPKGIIGTYIGEKMVRQHKTETNWTLELMNVQKGDRILELGCGAGYAIKLLLEKDVTQEIVGLDISPTIIVSAKFRNKKAIKEKRAKLVQANLNKLPFDHEYFNSVFSIQTIYFWTDIETTLSEIFRVLKPEGVVILTFSDGKEGETWEGIRGITENKVIPGMKNAGFTDVALVKGPDSRGYHTVAVRGTKQ
ncbi:class I SAM-dependent methyltransferase [Bacillus sp. ISL-37]|jgi:ubiquinone/menaquinone biosynthesis C-methylase UbiE|uniref:class I SAM-dependent methyltransferase n=1 Tax=Bacillus sp. ISL-37 TaxID=2819123 RepID=UPI001BECFF1D|nr:class I SAM-dependent methyltransferase [Bacillus sp. ISL-37]MBT2682262.1 methyltransferase domain-containing protein [Bacillus sp. ISL-37]